jgi:undecaprenyl-diphosphatase
VNYDLFRDINNLSGNGFVDGLMKFGAKYAIFIAFAVVAVLCLLRLMRRVLRPVIAVIAGLVVTFVLGVIEGKVHSEKRPFQSHHVHQLIAHSPGQSFPSDHATAAFGLAFATLAFLSWRCSLAVFVLAVWIGFARVYDGIHYPLDILGSFLAAAVGVGLVYVVDRLLRGDHEDGMVRADPA